MIYGQYGLNEIDSVSSSTSVSSLDLDFLNASGDSSYLFLRAQLQSDNDVRYFRTSFLDSSNNLLDFHYKTFPSGTTANTNAQGNVTNTATSMQYWANGNTSSSTWSSAELFTQTYFIKYQRRSTAPISRVSGHVFSYFSTDGGQYTPTFAGFYVCEDTEVDTIRLSINSGTFKGKAVLYSLCGNTDD